MGHYILLIYFIYVLPWIEEKPVLKLKSTVLTPIHFRDIGITYIALKIVEGSI